MKLLFIPLLCPIAGILLLPLPVNGQTSGSTIRSSQYRQSSPQDQITRLKRLPRLGMSLKELELLWGPGKQDDLRNYLPLTEPNKKGLRGMIFNNGATCSWIKDPLKLVASFVDGKCVSLLVYVPKETNKESAIKIMETLMPNITFPELEKLANNVKFVSKEKSGAYTFSYSTQFNIIFLEAPGLTNLPKEEALPIRRSSDVLKQIILKQERKANEAHRKDLLKKKRTELTREEWEILMGPPTNEKTNWKSSKAIEWSIPPFSLRVTFEKGKCNQIILSNENIFSAVEALEFMQKLMPGCRFEKKDIGNPNNVYILSSVDARKRYKAIWNHHSAGAWHAHAMEIIDNFPSN